MRQPDELAAKALAQMWERPVVDPTASIDELRRVAASCIAARAEGIVICGAALCALLAAGESFRSIESHTGVPKATASRWMAIYRHSAGKGVAQL